MPEDNDDSIEDDFDEDEDEDAQKDKYLTFRIGKETYGIDIYHVVEIVAVQKITPVPDMPDYVKGVINLRGQIIPIMDVRTRFHIAQLDYDDRTCIIIVFMEDTMEDITVGLAVDTVEEVADIPHADVSPPPKTGRKRGIDSYIKGMGRTADGVKILLDIGRLLFRVRGKG